MSLPPGFLDELRARLSLGQVVGRKVIWDRRKTNQAKGDLWAPCPFHQEKTASFHVDDRKGFYYCFGCHAKGDAISFVRETENVDFIEAIRILASEAGLSMPERDPKARQQADRRSLLTEVMEQAVQWARLQLKTSAATEARAYLARRGLSEAALARWEIGYAPPRGMVRHLTDRGIAVDLVIEAGLAAKSDRNGSIYDRFRDRILFPIRDARGRAIAFGGRAMDPHDPAKYYNSPETPLFDKGRSLYNHGPARAAAGKGQPLIVAEGYMDVIALSEAGFAAAVAPLGTAITEHQLALLWRMTDEPVIALDGDAAGLRAAHRVIDLALPLLQAGKSLRFALLPEGLDPDDLIRAQGTGAMRDIIERAQPMLRLLWQREVEGRPLDSPERKAALDRALRQRIATIRDEAIRFHYAEEIRQLRWELLRPNAGRRRGRSGQRAPQAMPTTRASLLAVAADHDHIREGVILATLIANPECLIEFEAELERFETTVPEYAALRDAILRIGACADLRVRLAEELGEATLENVFSVSHVAITPAVRSPGNLEAARMCLAEELAKLDAGRGHTREIQEAVEDLTSDFADEHVTARLAQSSERRNRAGRINGEDRTEYDTGPNGARIKRDERVTFDRLLNQIDFARGGRRPSSQD